MSDDATTFFERILERGARAGSRAVGGGQLHPMEILAEVEDAARRGLRDGVAPNQYVIAFNEVDYAKLTSALPDLRTQVERLLDRIEAREGYDRLGPRLVQFQPSNSVEAGETRVEARFADTRHRPARAAVGATQRLQRQTGYLLLASDGTQVELTHTPFTIGRSSRNDLLLANLAVSREHARIIETAHGLAIEDLKSRNGLLVDGERCALSLLQPRQAVRIGDIYLWIERKA